MKISTTVLGLGTLALGAALLLPAAAQEPGTAPASPASWPRHRPLVELFTSQG